MPESEQPSGQAAAFVLMALVLLWSGALAVGFAWAAATGHQQMGFGRTVVFWVVAAFLGLLAVRTCFELVRRVVGR